MQSTNRVGIVVYAFQVFLRAVRNAKVEGSSPFVSTFHKYSRPQPIESLATLILGHHQVRV
ncbi:MAG: hypothetical protein AMXMBFR20_33470 [Planctomycetia bacterium]